MCRARRSSTSTRTYEWPGGDYDLERLFEEEDVTAAAEAIQGIGRRMSAACSESWRRTRCRECRRARRAPSPTAAPTSTSAPRSTTPSSTPSASSPALPAPSRRERSRPATPRSSRWTRPPPCELITYSDGRPHERWFTTWKATATRERIVLPEFVDWVAELPHPDPPPRLRDARRSAPHGDAHATVSGGAAAVLDPPRA